MAEGSKKPTGDDTKADASVLRQVGAMAGLGLEFIATVMVPGAVGYWLDGKFGTSPWLILIGGSFGFAVGLYRMIKISKASMR